MTIQRQEEQRCSSRFYCGNRTAGGGRREKTAKFLNYEDRLEIQNGLKEHLTFTEIGKRLRRDRKTITKEVRNYSVEQMDSVFGSKGGKVLLTVYFVNVSLMLGFLREANTSKSVIDIYDGLYQRLGGQDFRRLFP